MAREHCPQVVVALNCRVDEEIAVPLVLLNHLPFIRTFNSCQGGDGLGGVWARISMTSMSEASDEDFIRFSVRLARTFDEQFPRGYWRMVWSDAHGPKVTFWYDRCITDLVNKYLVELVNREITDEQAKKKEAH